MILQIWLPWDLKTAGKYLEGNIVPFLPDWKIRKHIFTGLKTSKTQKIYKNKEFVKHLENGMSSGILRYRIVGSRYKIN